MSKLVVCLFNSNAKIPERQHSGDAGYDLTSCENISIMSHSQALVSTGIKVKIPINHYGRIAPRSGFSSKKHTDIGAGVIDSGYRGVVKILVRNLSPLKNLEIKQGDRIAQLILEKISTPPIIIQNQNDFDNEGTTRGECGFGSTDDTTQQCSIFRGTHSQIDCSNLDTYSIGC